MDLPNDYCVPENKRKVAGGFLPYKKEAVNAAPLLEFG